MKLISKFYIDDGYGQNKITLIKNKTTLFFTRHHFISKGGVKIPGFSPAQLWSETAGVPAPPYLPLEVISRK